MNRLPTDLPGGATILNPNEAKGLKAKYITTQAELNFLEQENILKAQAWVKGKNRDVLSEKFLRDLHKKMFGDVWNWAGKFRTSGKNIGIDWQKIPVELKKLFDDVQYWIDNQTYDWDEIGARFHHRLVYIHAFPNGNGRHARLMSDALMEINDQEPFSWGLHLMERGETDDKRNRELYITALWDADKRKFDRLIKFVRS